MVAQKNKNKNKNKNENKETRMLKTNYQRRKLAKEILKALAVGGILTASLALPNLPQVLKFLGVVGAKDKYRVKRTIYNLKEKRLVSFGENGLIEITEKGKRRVLQYDIEDMNIKLPPKWDGYWRIVIFDVPEKFKKARNALSGKIKELGLFPLQKSVFVYPFECRNEIDFVSEFFNVGKFVHYIVAKELDSEKFLKQYFGL